jgi:hypothetical protein
MELALAAEARAGSMLQNQASAFKLSTTKYKPIKDNPQAIASFALRDKIASNFVKIGET